MAKQSKIAQDKFVEDLVSFLKNQPGQELRADHSSDFFRVYPQHVGKVKKFKKFITQTKCFRWIASNHPSLQKITLALPSPEQEPERNETDQPRKQRIFFVETEKHLASVSQMPPFCGGTGSDVKFVAIDCEGVPESLDLIQVAHFGGEEIFVFDCVTLGPEKVCKVLREMLRDKKVTKLFHDLHKDAAALASIGGVEEMVGTLDTQLAIESLTGRHLVGFNEMLASFKVAQHQQKENMQSQMNADRSKMLFRKRPMARHVLEYAALDVALLMNVVEPLKELLDADWDSVQRASDSRALHSRLNQGSRQLCFDRSRNFALASYELLLHTRPDDIEVLSNIDISDDAHVLMELLPSEWVSKISCYTDKLSEIVVDLGRRPYAWVEGKRVFLHDDDQTVVTEETLGTILEKVGDFGTDNRAGLERQLHRISALRNRNGKVIGLTMRVGRHISGNADMIVDLLHADPTRSILFLGEPGSGKTTIVREVTRLLAERENVCIVDTSNEIAGDGDVTHPCVGQARRLMVPSLDHQASVMIECVQNHSPQTIVIDEIGRKKEVQAAQTCKQRGVRLIASAHGDLRKLVKNSDLRGLIGGVEHVTLGDGEARREQERRFKTEGSLDHPSSLRKVKAQRAAAPIFEIVVELSRTNQSEWRIVMDAAPAVDSILDGGMYKSQVRSRNSAQSSSFHVELVRQ